MKRQTHRRYAWPCNRASPALLSLTRCRQERLPDGRGVREDGSPDRMLFHERHRAPDVVLSGTHLQRAPDRISRNIRSQPVADGEPCESGIGQRLQQRQHAMNPVACDPGSSMIRRKMSPLI